MKRLVLLLLGLSLLIPRLVHAQGGAITTWQADQNFINDVANQVTIAVIGKFTPINCTGVNQALNYSTATQTFSCQTISGGAGGSSFPLTANVSANNFNIQLIGAPITPHDVLGEGWPIGAIQPASGAFTSLALTTPLPLASGGTGTTTPGIVAGTNVTVTGTWPNQTINASGSGGAGYPTGAAPQIAGYSGTATAEAETLGGDCALARAGSGAYNITCLKTNGQNFVASAFTDTTNAANIASGTLPTGRMPLGLTAAPAAGAIPVGNGSTYANQAISGDSTMLSTGVMANTGLHFGANGIALPTVALTSGGVLYASSASALASSAALTANLPVLGGGAGAAPISGARSGNTTTFATTSGALISGDFAKFDASGNIIDGGGGSSGTGTINAGSNPAIAQYVGASSSTVGPATISGDCTLANLGALTCTKTGGVAFAASATTNTTNATNITSGTLPAAQMPLGITAIPAAGNLLIGNAGGTAYASVTPTGDFAITSAGVSSVKSLHYGTNGIALPASPPTSGGILYYPSALAIASSSLLTASNPVLGGGTGNPPFSGTRQGNTTTFATTTGVFTTGDFIKIDANGNLIDGGTGSGGGGSGTVATSSVGQIAAYSGTTTVTGLTNPIGLMQGGTACIGPTYFSMIPTATTGAICTILDAPACTDGVPVTTGNGPATCTMAYNGSNWMPMNGSSGGAGGGSGIVNAGVANQIAYYPSNAATVNGFTMGGDCSFTPPNITCTKSAGTQFAASALIDATNATNISSGTLNNARLNITFSGNTTKVATVSGALTTGDIAKWDASGNLIDGGGGAGTGTINAGSNPAIAQYVGASSTTVGPATVSGDCTLANLGAITCTKTGGTNFTGAATMALPVALANGGTACGAPTIFASLPTAAVGDICTVTDATACTQGTAVTVGGGAVKCSLAYNGTNWLPINGAAGGAGSGTVNSATINQIAYYAATGTAVSGATLGGDCTFSAGSITCTKTSGVAFVASATTDTTNATNIASGTLNAARMPLGITATPAAGAILVGNAGATAYASVAASGDCTLASTGALTCTKTGGVAFAASATTDTTNATNIGSGTLGASRLPSRVHILSGATPTAVVNSATVGGIDINDLPLSANVTSFNLPVGAAVADTQELIIEVRQPASGGPWTLPTGTAGTPFTVASGSLVNTQSSIGGCPSIGTAAGNEILYDLHYRASLTEWQLVGCPTNPAQNSPYDPVYVINGTPSASQKFIAATVRQVNFGANFANSQAVCGTNPAEADGYLLKCGSTELGAVCLSTSCVATWCTGAACTTACASGTGATQSCAAGNKLELDAPATVSGSNIGITFAGTR